jgi:hypothetical protein
MKMKFFGLMLGGLMLLGASAQAAVLSLDATNSTPGVLPLNFNPGGFPGGLVTPGTTPITIYSGPATPGSLGGLTLDSSANLTFQYLGKEAGFANTFDFGGDLFNTNTSAVGDSVQVLNVAAGIIPFLFHTGALSAQNGGPISAGISMAFADLGDGSFLALFNDGGGQDFDFDDLAVRVSISAVPLPAAAWLLLSAVLGLVSFSRIRRSGAQTA